MPLKQPVGTALTTGAEGGDEYPAEGAQETVGSADAQADAVRSGAADALEPDAPRESEGVPVGREDAEMDAQRSGADPNVF